MFQIGWMWMNTWMWWSQRPSVRIGVRPSVPGPLPHTEMKRTPSLGDCEVNEWWIQWKASMRFQKKSYKTTEVLSWWNNQTILGRNESDLLVRVPVGCSCHVVGQRMNDCPSGSPHFEFLQWRNQNAFLRLWDYLSPNRERNDSYWFSAPRTATKHSPEGTDGLKHPPSTGHQQLFPCEHGDLLWLFFFVSGCTDPCSSYMQASVLSSDVIDHPARAIWWAGRKSMRHKKY